MTPPRTGFTGSMVALATPFRDGKVDETALRKLVDFQLAGGTDVLVPCGTTGESPTLSPDERQRITALVVEQVRGRVPVLAGGPGNDTASSVDAAKRAKAAGASGILAVTPYYNKPTQEGHVRHLAAIAEAGLPVVAYNVPSRTGGGPPARDAGAAPPRGHRGGEGGHRLLLRCWTSWSRPTAASRSSRATTSPWPPSSCGGQGVISVSANVAPRRMKAPGAGGAAGGP